MSRYTHLMTLLTLIFINPLQAELKVSVTEGNLRPIPIAIPLFAAEDAQMADYARSISDVIANDLSSSGLFRPVDRTAFIQGNGQYLIQPHFSDWRLVQAEALVVGKVTPAGSGRINVEFRLFDVYAERQIGGVSMTADIKDWRRIAHRIADVVYERLTGDQGYFDTKILYVAEHGSGKDSKTRLATMDQDGENHHYLTEENRIVMSPRYSPDMRQIVFMDYGANKKTPRVYVLDLNSRVQRQLGTFGSMTFAPRFMPDGSTVLMSISEKANSSIHAMNIRSGQISRLTSGAWIDTSPCASPDGRQIVFNSDREGSQQLYIMNADGSYPRRISYGSGRYATPVWSPRGDLIAFTKIEGGEFFIGVIRPDGTGERLLARGYLVEEPSWSPNGRVLIYTKQMYPQKGKPKRARLYKIDLTGYHEREVQTPANENALSPAWSPRLGS